MSDVDLRSYRIALLADRYVNPPAGGWDAIPVLLECGWGLMQLPSEAYGAETADLMLEQVAEQAEEFARRGYALALIGSHPRLGRALGAAGVSMPDRIDPKSAEELRAFLLQRPAPAAARQSPATRPPRG